VVTSVVFDGEALSVVKQVRTPDETAFSVMDRDLNFRSRESGEQEEHP
jgi:hypothetical protein